MSNLTLESFVVPQPGGGVSGDCYYDGPFLRDISREDLRGERGRGEGESKGMRGRE